MPGDIETLKSQSGLYLAIGEGTIGPAERLKNGEITTEMIDDFKNRLLTDEFYDDIDPETIANMCVDGRGLELVGPNAAAGTLSYVIGDALTVQSFRLPGENVEKHARRMFGKYVDLGQSIGGHDDEAHPDLSAENTAQAHNPDCGCAACDKLDNPQKDKPSILRTTVKSVNEIRGMIEHAGVDVSDGVHNTIVGRAASLQHENYATNGSGLRNVYKEVGGPSSVRTLPGLHREVVAVVNAEEGKTLNRQRVYNAYGGLLQAFNIDVPNLAYGSNLFAANRAEMNVRFIGSLYYNFATAAAIAHPSLGIIVRG